MISVKDFILYGENKKIICGPLSFEIVKNTINCIQGPNGAGKSSFIKYLINKNSAHSGLLKITNPKTTFSYLPQFYSNDFQLPTTIQQILSAFQVKSKYMSDEIPEDLLWRTCSGGEKQKILLDIVLNTKADILLLDEPLNNLDEKSKLNLWNALENILNSNQIKSVVIISHESPTITNYHRILIK